MLKVIGVLGASLFGSVARGDAGPDSDVDVVVRLGQ
jgi:predicted nucleotidyltransferase